MEKPAKTSRSSRPKVRTGCITCKIRRVKCDEAKPHCIRCVGTGRKCDGYVSPTSLSLNVATSTRETRALEFFYHNTAPQLSGCLGASFWKVCIQQLAITEPSIRNAIIAIGILHESKTAHLNSSSAVTDKSITASAMQFYNKAIKEITKRASSGAGAFPVVVVACIAFICFEALYGRLEAALNHVKSGINLVRAHRKTHGQPSSPWGQSYSSFQSSFLETELAPTLSTINTSIREFSQIDVHFPLNPLDDEGIPMFGQYFRTLPEAGVALLDLHNAGLKLFQSSMGVYQFDENETTTTVYIDRVQCAVTLWGINFEALVEQNQTRWTEEEKHAIESLRLTWLTMKIGVFAGGNADDTWDEHLYDFKEAVRIATFLIPAEHAEHDPKLYLQAFSYERSLIDPLTTIAFKCRWPRVRRQALDLLLRIRQREYFFDATHTHIVLSRIMEMEEASLNLPPGVIPPDELLPPADARIHYFTVTAQPVLGSDVYGVTFLKRDNGNSSAWHFHRENIRLPAIDADNTTPRLRQVVSTSSGDLFGHSLVA